MPTILGIVFLIFAVWFFWRGKGRLFGFLIFTSIFGAASVLNFGSSGLQPYYFVGCIYLFSQYKHLNLSQKSLFPGARPLFLFVIVGITTAIICPRLFAGLPVYSPTISIDEGLLYRPPLEPGFSNIVQSAFLILNALILVAASREKRSIHIDRFYNFAFYFLISIIFTQFLLIALHISADPFSFLRNNKGYSIAMTQNSTSARLSGTFSEPSGVGIALVIFFAGYFQRFFARSEALGKLLLSFIAIGLTRSSSSLGATVLVIGWAFVQNPPFRFPWYIRLRRVLMIGALCLVPVLIVLSPLRRMFSAQTVNKVGSESFVSRITADLYAFHITYATHFLGSGLGSNRPSSLIPSLLSNVGVAGTICFALLLFRLTRQVKHTEPWVGWALTAGILDMCFGGPDINQPLIWAAMALTVYYGNAGDAIPTAQGLRTRIASEALPPNIGEPSPST